MAVPIPGREWLPMEPNGLLKIEQLDNLLPQQQKTLDDFKQLISEDLAAAPGHDAVTGDVRLLRFLRATKYEITESAEMFRRMMTWRVEENIDAIHDDIVAQKLEPTQLPGYQKFVRYLPIRFYLAQDFEGNPICRDMLGGYDIKGALADMGEPAIRKFWIYHQEYRMLLLDKLSREQNRMVLVYEIKDLLDVSMGQLYSAKDLLTRLASINTSYYVETTRRVAAINLPWVFNTLYGLAKPFIPQRSLAKIKIVTNAKDIDAQMSEDMELSSFNTKVATFDLKPVAAKELAEGEFATPDEQIETDKCEIDPQELYNALVALSIVTKDLDSGRALNKTKK